MSQRKTLGSLLVRLGMSDREAERAIKDFERKLKRFETSVKATGQAMSIGFTAPFIAGIAKAIQAYDEEAQVSRKLQIALGGTSAALKEQAARMQQTTKYADDEIIKQQAWAAALGHTETQILDMTEAAVGLAAGLGIGLDEAMKGLHQTTLGSARSLGKLIPEIKNMTAEQLKSGAAIDLVKEKFKGYAEAAALTGAGPITQLKNVVGDLAEQIGEAALPIVVAFADKIKSLIITFQNLSPEVKQMAIAFGTVVAAIGPVMLLLPKLISLISVLISPVGLAVIAIGTLGAALIYLSQNIEAIDRRLNSSRIGAWLYQTAKDMKAWNMAVNPLLGVISGGNPFAGFINMGKTMMGQEVGNYSQGPGGRAQSWHDKGKDMKSFKDSLIGFGNDIWDMIGGNNGQKIIDEANRKLEALAHTLSNVEDSGTGAGKVLKRLAVSLQPIGSLPIAGSLSPSEGGTRSDPAAGMKNIGVDMTGALKAQNQALQDYQDTWMSVANAVGGAISTLAEDLRGGMDAFAAFGKAALLAAAQVAKAAMAKVAAEAIASGATKGLPGILIGASAAIAGISILESLIAGIKAPKLAGGGLAFGPTMAVVGDNPNAHVDPEVISPLSKLKGMMQQSGRGAVDVHVTGEIAGDVIRLSAARSQDRAFRRGAGTTIPFTRTVTY